MIDLRSVAGMAKNLSQTRIGCPSPAHTGHGNFLVAVVPVATVDAAEVVGFDVDFAAAW